MPSDYWEFSIVPAPLLPPEAMLSTPACLYLWLPGSDYQSWASLLKIDWRFESAIVTMYTPRTTDISPEALIWAAFTWGHKRLTSAFCFQENHIWSIERETHAGNRQSWPVSCNLSKSSLLGVTTQFPLQVLIKGSRNFSNSSARACIFLPELVQSHRSFLYIHRACLVHCFLSYNM